MPRDTLTRESIVAAAIELLDAEGLEGLNMRALGKRLGSAATAVYWHVESKANLIALAGDRVWSEIPLSDLGTTHWRTATIQMSTDLHTTFTRHPWVVQAFGSYVIFGPGRARYDDHTLAVYEAAGFTGAQADQAAAIVFTFVLGNALGPAASASISRKLGRDGGSVDEGMRASMARARELAAEFPRLRTRVDVPAADYAAAPENTFEFGLRAILDGLEAAITAPKTNTARRPPRPTSPARRTRRPNP
jgi:AcrR family transcriptional regulator